MNRKSLSFLIQKLYLPLGMLVLLLGFGIVVLQSAREKEFRLSLLIQEVAHVHLNIEDAAILMEKHSLEAVPVKALQITKSLSRIESNLMPDNVSQQVSIEWNSIKSGWDKLKGVGTQQSQTSNTLNAKEKQRLTLNFSELQILCLRLNADLQTELLQAELQGKIALAFILALCLGLLAFGVYFMHTAVLSPLHRLAHFAEELANGKDSSLQGSNNVLVEPVYSKLLQDLENRKYLALASEQIGDGNFQQDEAALERGGMLGASVLRLRQKIQSYFMAEQRRNWSSQGLEQFTVLLREQSITIDGLCKSLVSELVPFMNASQGAVFVTDEDEQGETVLQLQASYAWGRHKFLSKTIYPGEGLIGQVVQEKETLMITDVPEGYITIGSGLGRAKPRCILIMPLITNEVFQGAIELASFRVFEEYELEFLRKLAESVAASVANLKSSTKTKELLEKANAANVHLQAQEEELRQNTEELLATQEAMEKKDMELMGLFASIDYSLCTAEFDLDGLLLTANDKFKQFLHIMGKDHQAFQCFQLIKVPGWTEQEMLQFKENLQMGEPQNVECQLVRHSKTWMTASFTPVLNASGQVYKVMMLGSDISDKKNAQLAYMAQAEEITRQEEKLRHYTSELEELQASLSTSLKEAHQEMEQQIRDIALEKEKNLAILEGCVDGVVSFNEKGIIEYFNHAAEEIWEIPREQALGSNIRKLISIEIQYKGAEPQVFFSKNGNTKRLDIRTEVPLFGANGEEIEALLTLTRVKIENTYMFTAFVQKVAVELF